MCRKTVKTEWCPWNFLIEEEVVQLISSTLAVDKDDGVTGAQEAMC